MSKEESRGESALRKRYYFKNRIMKYFDLYWYKWNLDRGSMK